MNYLSIKKEPKNKLYNYVNVLNYVMKSTGYNFVYIDKNKIALKQGDDKVIREVDIIPEQKTTEFYCGIGDNKTMNFYYHQDSYHTEIEIKENDKICEIYFECEDVDDRHPYFTETGSEEYYEPRIIFTDLSIDFDDSKYEIKFDRYNDIMSFVKYEDDNKNIELFIKSIDISRDDSSATRLSFGTRHNHNIKIIESSGYEEVLKYGLDKECFNVIYSEIKENGALISVNHTNDIDFKHYSNIKLINNSIVRNFLDEFVSKYKEYFVNDDFKDSVLGGTLFNAYLYGKPNNSKVSEKMLEDVDFIERVNNKSRRRKR